MYLKSSAVFAILFIEASLGFCGCVSCPDPCCPPPDPCSKCAQIWPERGPDWIITPNGGPCVYRGYDAHITLAFLYWTAREDHLAFATVTPFENGSAVTRGKVLYPDWNFQPGFKLGAGILFDHDGWDFTALYTWFREDDAHKKFHPHPNDSVNLFSFFDPIEPTIALRGSWRLEFNVVDLELGRNFFISRFLRLRPHFGLKGTWQMQTLDVHLFQESFEVKDFHHFRDWGIGMRAGLNSSWHLNHCWSLLGDIAATAIWEYFSIRFEEKQFFLNEILIPIHLKNCTSLIKPVIELYLGGRYETWFCCDSYHFSIEAGWEMQWWGDQNQFFLSENAFRNGNLFLNGFTLKGRLDF